ncbi:sodium-dependent glucose transporter 1-like [Mizuhopecten yessoensis]|uniref:Sodium-dependent glucose transporter 1A n=1 Tax=Mizuhopecten yessoensis TaxID=6573 RepID=A0A210PP12_MIZYE|nr:sodium-dependent glucose transporter 1-like [Mizuhopecten yessoensis]OWF38208.1 Sodium-dependent glucose transporter 1A [Mizuhopecten yessoensis]
MEKEEKYGIQSSDLDAVPMQEINIGKDNSYEQKPKESFCSEFRNSNVIQSQIKRSVCNSGAYMIMGWTKGQIGPSFPDIMIISGADLENGSAFMTSFYTGRLLGSVLAGVIYSKINKHLLFGASLILYSLMVAAIPWCYLYELMVAAHTLFGVCGGILSVAIGCETVDIWGPTPRGHSYLMGNSAMYAIASVLAPLVTAPFLLQKPHYNKNNTSWNSTSYYSPIYTLLNSTNQSGLRGMDLDNDKSAAINRSMSKLYVAYTISAVLSMLTAMLFLILFCQLGPSEKERSQKGESHFIGERSPLLKRLQLFNTSVFSVLQNAIDFTFIGYLPVFCIDYLGWTNAFGAMVTSVAFFSRLLGTLSGIFLVRYVQPHQILLISTIVSTAGFIGLTISAHFYFDAGIWISVCVIGIPFGLMWPNMLSWFNENLIPLRGAVSGFLHFTVFLGALLAPLLFGYMMKEISLLWFCYLCCIKSIVIVVNAILMFIYTDNKR